MKLKEAKKIAKKYRTCIIEYCQESNNADVGIYNDGWLMFWSGAWVGSKYIVRGCKCINPYHVFYLYINGKKVNAWRVCGDPMEKL